MNRRYDQDDGADERGPSTQLATCARGQLEELRVSLDEFKGHRYLSIRVWTRAFPTGQFTPTKKGVTIKLREIVEVGKALREAFRLTSDAPQPTTNDRHANVPASELPDYLARKNSGHEPSGSGP
jgi:hypothetical protein